MEKTGFGEPRAKIWEVDIAEFVARRDGQFERRAFQMIDEDLEIVGLDESVLGRVAEEIVGMAKNEWIERRRGGPQHCAGASPAPGAQLTFRTSTSDSRSREARSPGLAMVAEQQMNWGWRP